MSVTSWPRWADMPEFHELPDGWSIGRLTDHIDVIAGQSPPSETYNDKGDGMPFLQGCTEFGDEIPITKFWCTAPNKIAPSDSTLMSVRAPVGELNRADQNYAIGRGLAALVAKGMNPDFLYYGLYRWRQSFQRLGQGSTFEAITARQLKQVIVAAPTDENEQRRIAAALKLADDAIATAKAELEATRELKRSLTSELLQPPKGAGWDKTTFASLVSEKIRNGYSPACPQDPTGAWVLGLDALTDYGFNPQGIKPAPIEDEGFFPFRLVVDDILVSRSNTPELVGRSGRYVGNPEIAYYPDLMMRIRVNRDLVSPEFAEMLLQSSSARRWLKSRASGTSGSMVKIKRRDIMSLPVLLPDTTKQNEIVEAVSAAKKAVASAENKLFALHQVKKSLLPNLLTGKIRIPEGAVHG